MVRLGLRAVEIPWSRLCTSYFIPGISALYGGLVVFAISDTPRSSPYGSVLYSGVLGEIEQPRFCLPSRPDLYKHDLSTVSQPQHCPGRGNDDAEINSTSEPIRTPSDDTILRIVLHTPRIYTRTKQLDPIRSNDKVRLGPAPTTTQRPKSGSWTGVPVRSCGPQRFGDASHARQATISILLCCFFFCLLLAEAKSGACRFFSFYFCPSSLACRRLVLFAGDSAGRCGSGLCRLVCIIVAAGIGDLQ